MAGFEVPAQPVWIQTAAIAVIDNFKMFTMATSVKKPSHKKLRRMTARALEMYTVLDDLRRTVFVNGGHPDDIMRVAADALQLVRIIDLDLPTCPQCGVPRQDAFTSFCHECGKNTLSNRKPPETS